jgi:hypothetical protein
MCRVGGPTRWLAGFESWNACGNMHRLANICQRYHTSTCERRRGWWRAQPRDLLECWWGPGANPWRNRTPRLSHPLTTVPGKGEGAARRKNRMVRAQRPVPSPPLIHGRTLGPAHGPRGRTSSRNRGRPARFRNQGSASLHAHPRPPLGHSTGQPAPGVPAGAVLPTPAPQRPAVRGVSPGRRGEGGWVG